MTLAARALRRARQGALNVNLVDGGGVSAAGETTYPPSVIAASTSGT